MTSDNCCCKVGPGRMEAEPAETAMLECFALDGSGEQHGPEGAGYEYFGPVDDASAAGNVFGPADFTDDVVNAARQAGFCWPCIARGIDRLMTCHGAVFGVTEQGFRWSKVADDAAEHGDMLARMAEDDADAEAADEANEANENHAETQRAGECDADCCACRDEAEAEDASR